MLLNKTTWIRVLLVAGLAGSSTAATAQTPARTQDALQRATVLFVAPPNRGTPPTSAGTGSRGGCLTADAETSLTALTGTRSLSLTVSSTPTIWIYVPYSGGQAPTVELSLHANDDEVARTVPFALPDLASIVGIQFPSDTLSLEPGQEYEWFLDITCPASSPSEEPEVLFLTGTVRRVIPSAALEQDLAIAQTPLERLAAYARHHIWYDTLTGLAMLRVEESENEVLVREWTQLLADPDVGLEEVAGERIYGVLEPALQPE